MDPRHHQEGNYLNYPVAKYRRQRCVVNLTFLWARQATLRTKSSSFELLGKNKDLYPPAGFLMQRDSGSFSSGQVTSGGVCTGGYQQSIRET